MAGAKTEPLTVEQAKAQLREAADHVSLVGIVKRHPFATLAVSFVAGAVLSQAPVARLLLRGGNWSKLLSVAAAGAAAAQRYQENRQAPAGYLEAQKPLEKH